MARLLLATLCASALFATRALSTGARTVMSTFDGQSYATTVTDGSDASSPPLVLLPPVGVGIDRVFYRRFQEALPGIATHAPDLLGTGTAFPKPRRFYGPEVWARQVDAYVREQVGGPCVLVVQGGLLPCALEMWRLGGKETIAGLSLLSPPPLKFVCGDADVPYSSARLERSWPVDAASGAVAYAPPGPPVRRASRKIQRLAWAASASPVGNAFFRRLRGKKGERIREFTAKNLFADAEKVDDEWVAQCFDSARDARGRFATLSYLCGTIPAGGSWRDDRGALLDTLAVPTQIVRGNFMGAFDPWERTRAALSRLPFPADSFVVPDARACLPYEQPEKTAACLRHFLDSYAPASDGAAPDGVALVPAPEAS